MITRNTVFHPNLYTIKSLNRLRNRESVTSRTSCLQCFLYKPFYNDIQYYVELIRFLRLNYPKLLILPSILPSKGELRISDSGRVSHHPIFTGLDVTFKGRGRLLTLQVSFC